MHQSPGRV